MPVPLQVLTYCGSYINFTYRHSVCGSYHVVFKGPFIASQLNSTRLDVELRRRSVYSDADATQLNSTQLNSTSSCRHVYSGPPTQLNSTQLNSTLSWVELRRYKRALTCKSRHRSFDLKKQRFELYMHTLSHYNAACSTLLLWLI